MDLKSTLIKMKETAKTEADFTTLVESMKRRASKGLIEGVSAEDITAALRDIETIDENNTKENIDLTDISIELDEANAYIDEYLDSLTESELSHLLAEEYCNVINEGWIADTAGKVWNGIKTFGGNIVNGVKTVGSAASKAFDPVTGAARGPAIGGAIALGIGAAGIGAIIARLRRRKANVTEAVEFIKYFNDEDIKYILENAELTEEVCDSIFESDDENMVNLTEEVLSYTEDIILEAYVDSLTESEEDELLEELQEVYSISDEEILNEKEEVFYHTRRYNERQKKRYNEHPVRTTAIGIGSTAAAGTGAFLGADAIVKQAQYDRDVANRTQQAVDAYNTAASNFAAATEKAGGAVNSIDRNKIFADAGSNAAFTSAEEAGKAAGATAIKQETIASKIGKGIRDAAATTGEFIKNNPVVKGALVGGGAVLSAVLVAKLIKKIAQRRKVRRENKAQAEGQLSEAVSAVKTAKLKKKYTPDNVDIKNASASHPFNHEKTTTLANKSLEISDNDDELAEIKEKIDAEVEKPNPDKSKLNKLYAEYKELYKKKKIKKQAKDQLKAEKIEAKIGRNALYEDYDLDKPIGEILMEDLYE